MWCVLEHFHVLEHRALLETNTGGELSLLCWIKPGSKRSKPCSERIQWVLSEDKGQLMAACSTTGCSTCSLFPRNFLCGSGMSWKKNKTVLGGAEEDKRGCWGGPESPRELEGCQKEKTWLEGSRRLKCERRFFSASLDELKGIWAWLVPCQLLITVSRHLSRAYQQKEISPWIIYTEKFCCRDHLCTTPFGPVQLYCSTSHLLSKSLLSWVRPCSSRSKQSHSRKNKI